jgi:hypothetical protein
LPKGADPAVPNKALRRDGKGVAMGEVIRFPDEAGCARGGKYVDANTEPATVIILPVIRVERDPDGSNGLEPDTGNTPGRRRRRRIAR